MYIEIECEEIKNVSPKDGRNIKVDAYVNERQAMDLFYLLWETWGNLTLKDWLNREGYELAIKKQLEV